MSIRIPDERATRRATSSEDVRDWVREALDVVALQWPLPIFIARHPWPALEHIRFEDAMGMLQDLQGTRLYPSLTVFRSALEHGDIHPQHLERRLRAWMEAHLPSSLRPQLGRLCRDLLMVEELPCGDAAPEVRQWAERTVARGEAPSAYPPVRLVTDASPDLARRLTLLTIRWCKLFLDRGQAAWRLPGRDAGLYGAWRRLASADPGLTRRERRRMGPLPEDPALAVREGLGHLGVPRDAAVDYLRAHLAALPGWVGLLRWEGHEAGDELGFVVDYLALRISLERILNGERRAFAAVDPVHHAEAVVPLLSALVQHAQMTPARWETLPRALRRQTLAALHQFLRAGRWQVWLEAWEDSYGEVLRERMTSGRWPSLDAPIAQLLFCIDVRSERFRRRIEAAGPFETYGCAGFYNLPMRTRDLDSPYAHPSCPAIVTPVVEVQEVLPQPALARQRSRRNALRLPGDVFKKVKQHVVAALALPELSGPWLGLYAIARTLAPGSAGYVLHQAANALERPRGTEAVIERTASPEAEVENGVLPLGFTVSEMVDIAGGLLRSIGLTSFAPLVVVCGHESRSANNAHAASLDCGACGGAAGRWNARVFAAICNRKDVRTRLAAEYDIEIPEDTVFVAAEHITTTDTLEWLDVPPLPSRAQTAWLMLRQALHEVQRETTAERLRELPDPWPRASAEEAALRRAGDWSEVRPEWGLAGNFAFVVGRRQLTQGHAWDGRVFLHSYDWRLDPDGDRLAAIVAGPVTVAQWINLQYYASTVSPDVYGSGSKTTQTVTCGIGVMQGNGSDLLAGLPWQSVAADDRTLQHAPLRLWVVVEAPDGVIERLLERDPAFRRKVAGGWLRLASIDPVSGHWREWSRGEEAVTVQV
ncbi:MAG: DUF2309 domain-containing protein [Thermoflavifilum sp.]|nr:DUF2309 domain-containing protein [Thermoflavifilum sp.]MCL6512994.1 DUF2309 domain-containing protein [Alicyclobacillus sp.]